MPYLNAIFWDYPELTQPEKVRQFLKEHYGGQAYYWAMQRFLENGRVVDVFAFFPVEDIARALPQLRLSLHTRQKWTRIVEVYGGA